METGLTVKNLQLHSWALMIQEQTRSGLSIREWCKQNSIAPKTFIIAAGRSGLNCSRQHRRSSPN